MNDFELETRLKYVRPPERSEEYWNDFPARVRGQLPKTTRRFESDESWLPQFFWRWATSCAGLVIGLLVLGQPLKAASGAIFQQEQFVQQQLAALPGHLRGFMADEHGLHYLVVDKE